MMEFWAEKQNASYKSLLLKLLKDGKIHILKLQDGYEPFAILRATNLCLCSSLTKWRSSTGFDDGAGLRNLHVHIEMCVYVQCLYAYV